MTDGVTDLRRFRNVLGQYPTGVCVITASQESGTRAGFVVGSFTSISLDPPLVGFFADKKSSSWPKIEAAGRFCVNILSADQENLCRQFASKAEDKFAEVRTRTSGLGSPIIEEVVAWIDCELESVADAGDHYFVMGRVRDLAIESGALPLLFFQGGYGRFAPHSLIAAYTPTGVTTEQLRDVDLLRPIMESISAELSARCIVTAVVNDELVVLASAGSPHAGSRATLVGARLPFTPPNGSGIAAWYPSDKANQWLSSVDGDARQENARQLERVRERGYSVGLLNDAQRKFAEALDRIAEDPRSVESKDLRTVMGNLLYNPAELTEEYARAVRTIAVPVFNAAGEVEFAFTLYGFHKPTGEDGIHAYIARAVKAGQNATVALGGAAPVAVTN